jgi:riboflavin biosynthesis pyrimidine reductase
LSVRYCTGPQPKRVILASTLNIPTDSHVFAPGPGVMVIGAEGRAPNDRVESLEAAGASVKLVAANDRGQVSIREALAVIYDWGVRRLLVEGGACILTTLFRERLVDEATFEIVPILFGAPSVSSVANIGVVALEEAPKLIDICVTQMGTSIFVQGRLEQSSATEP